MQAYVNLWGILFHRTLFSEMLLRHWFSDRGSVAPKGRLISEDVFLIVTTLWGPVDRTHQHLAGGGSGCSQNPEVRSTARCSQEWPGPSSQWCRGWEIWLCQCLVIGNLIQRQIGNVRDWPLDWNLVGTLSASLIQLLGYSASTHW